MKKKIYIHPEVIFELLEPEGILDSLQNASKELTKSDDPEDENGFAKRSSGGFIFDDADSYNDFDE